MSTDADEKLKELFELSRLFDIYGALLGEHMAHIFKEYIFDNLSLSEIAGEVGLSRQGVRDTVVRCGAKLKGYEEKLGLLKKLTDVSSLLDEAGLELAKEDFSKTRVSELISTSLGILDPEEDQ